jgi:hypothetical protein
MNPIDLIFGAISNLTGGLITDLTTAVIGLLTISFIAMGADLIIGVFAGRRTDKCRSDRVHSAFDNLQKARESGSEVERDMAKSRYRSALSRYGRGRGDC